MNGAGSNKKRPYFQIKSLGFPNWVNKGQASTSRRDWWLSPGLENGPLWVHICRMGHNATVAVVATIIVTAAIYSLWALRSRK